MKIAIDPGHGGSDPGAVGPAGSREADVTLAVGRNLQALLVAVGNDIVMTRNSDTDVAPPGAAARLELEARCGVVNMAGADLFISIHCNAADRPDASGTETWYYGAGHRLAAAIQRRLATLGLDDRGVKQGDFYVLKYTDMPAVLVELAFISNPKEERMLLDAAFREVAAGAIARGILDYCDTG